MKAIQDYYPDHFSHCYGCGKLNEHGHQIKTYWDGDNTITRFVPKEYHTAIPGFVYGGLLASLIDCHGTGSAALALAKNQGIELSNQNAPRCVTASLQVKYLKPTPIDSEIVIRGKIKEISDRKAIVSSELYANDVLCVSGEVISVLVPDNFGS
ncbi:PaaI family thioesterase [Labilibaculum sp.]|uniref:PaaI family thioesterase n=1 Tax=Labilibaculum sp. TaxID=2060723 RepID=UPI003566B5C5